MIILVPRIGWPMVPWMTMVMLGYFYIAGLNLAQHGFWSASRWRRKTQPAATEQVTTPH